MYYIKSGKVDILEVTSESEEVSTPLSDGCFFGAIVDGTLNYKAK